MQGACVILPSVACPALQCFSILSLTARFLKQIIDKNVRLGFLYKFIGNMPHFTKK
jgi:hypothetical protein